MSSVFIITIFTVLCAFSINAQNNTVFPADSFADSIGVNTHWAFSGVYLYNYTGLKVKLAEAGIRYVRDGTFPQVFIRLNDLYDSFGVKTDMLTGRWKTGSWPQPLDPLQIDTELNDIKNQTLDAVVSLEAPNEYDLSHGPDTDWVGTIKSYSMNLYTKAKADEMLKNIPIIGPSFTSLEAYEAVGNSDPYLDLGNQHMYQWTYWPGFNGFDANGTRSITWYLDELARQQSPSGKPVHATEAGYTDFVDIGGVSEEAEGKYMARIFAEFFRRGVDRTYKYELVNQAIPGREGSFGLLRNDLSEKPSFRAVKNLIQIFSDRGPSFQPTVLNYQLSGESMDNVRQLLFQKRNGNFYLMVWLEVSSWDVLNKKDLYPPPQQVTLTWPADTGISKATLYAFNNTGDVNILNLPVTNNQVNFNATDKITVIKLNNGSAHSIPFGVYRFLPKNTLRSALGSNGQRGNLATVQPQHWSNINQHWIVQLDSDGFYHLINRGTGQVLQIEDDSVRLNDWSGLDSQKWKIDLLPNHYYQLTSKHVSNQWTADDQQWKLDWIAATI